jgi:ribosome maturation factor RimP
VSSPGIDRPLTRQKDFVRWTGFEARLETAREIEGRGRFHGRILAVSDTHLTVREDAGTIDLPLDALKRVKLVLNDELLAATKRAA